ncbi:MAG: QueT transporter family protein [Clostridiales bacterium]|jgi:uncharacterized membrane protein|nr:QueT transporter family protein [Clostridiales bacterium]
MKQNTKVKTMAVMAMVAAIYAAVTVSLAPISFGAIQFRLAESLNLLAFFNPIFAPAVVLGVLIANFFSPLGMIDIVLGTTSTAIAMVLLIVTKRLTGSLFLSGLWATIVNAAIIPLVILIGVGSEVTLAAYATYAAQVGIGQFVVVSIFGYAICRLLIARHPNFILMLEGL